MTGNVVPRVLRGSRSWLLAGAVVGTVVVSGHVGAAETSPPISACVRSSTGAVRIVSGSAACNAGETRLTWNTTGPAGPPGASADQTPLGRNGFLRCTGIEGDSTAKGHETEIEVLSWSHTVKSPRDAASGQASGKRTHHPVTFVKEWGASTPQFYHRLSTNMTIDRCVLSFVDPDDDGDGVLDTYMTVTMTGVQVSEVASAKGDTRMADERHLDEYATVSLVYQKIVWSSGGITAEDDWEAPVT